MIFENLAYFLNSSSSIMKNSKEFEAESKVKQKRPGLASNHFFGNNTTAKKCSTKSIALLRYHVVLGQDD